MPYIICFIILAYAIFSLGKSLHQERQLKRLVAWIVTTNYTGIGSIRPGLDLHHYIGEEQTAQNLPNEYLIISDDDWRLTKEILTEFQRTITQDYFNSRLSIIKRKQRITEEDYFFVSLTEFLKEHQCDNQFIGRDMHSKIISRKDYGSWGGQLYDATYSLTDFAILYHKVYYTAYNHCKSSQRINPNGDAFQNADAIKKILDTQQIEIHRI